MSVGHHLEELLGEDAVLARATDLIRYASDASPYRLLPQAVVMARDPDDVAVQGLVGVEGDQAVVELSQLLVAVVLDDDAAAAS